MSVYTDRLAESLRAVIDDFATGKIVIEIGTGVSGAKRISVVRK